MFADILISLRPRQWTKNLFIFASLVFSGALREAAALKAGLACFVFFCLLSSAAYLLNDLFDRKEDLLHGRKARRPIAGGRVPPGLALWVSAACACCGLAGLAWLGKSSLFLGCAYLAGNMLYSAWLKHVVIVDALCIALFFELRIWAGAALVPVIPSEWLQVCTFLFALFVSFAKRRDEVLSLKEAAAEHRRVLAQYTPVFIDHLIGLCAGASILAYALYTLSAEISPGRHGGLMIFTVPLVVYGIFRYLYLVYVRHRGGDPAEALFADRPLLTSLVLWVLAVIGVVYW